MGNGKKGEREMAYVIGSQKGKDIAKNMAVGQSWKNTTDGSTWTKQADGSVSVKTSSGQTFNNAYKPSSSGGGSAKNNYSSFTANGTTFTLEDGAEINGTRYNSGGGSGGGGSYSPYTVNGVTYNPNMDYGDHGEYLMSIGAPWEQVRDEAYQPRYYKTINEEGLAAYKNDDIMKKMLAYIEQGKNSAEQFKEDYEEEYPEPEQYEKDPRIDEMINQILNREDFSYDVMNDPLYQQYSTMYQREGDRAMKETMAEAAAGAGGMNSYAITAAQQAANNYSARLNDTIPQLYQLAYDMYLADKESQIQNLGILQNADATQYNRYRDTMDDYRNDRNFAYGVYEADRAQNNWQMEFDYNKSVADRDYAWNDLWTNKQWDYNVGRGEIEDGRYDKETAYNIVQYLISLGSMPPDALLQSAGLSESKAAIQAAVNNILSKSGGS